MKDYQSRARGLELIFMFYKHQWKSMATPKVRNIHPIIKTAAMCQGKLGDARFVLKRAPAGDTVLTKRLN